ncbi:hypothetical protein FQN50_005670 [Emmonsiellopsis sp. PD_5]|nr:hypothetical protein FQN50_005670 [Emmonsiellopsis sp. PD_5]
MRRNTFLSLFTLLLAAAPGSQADETQPECKCVQGDSCWPSGAEWKHFDKAVGGRLIKTEPVAQSCYPGEGEDRAECAYVTENWANQEFQTSHPIGRPYPYNVTCPPVDYEAGETPGTCILGSLPTYAVNATSRKHILTTMKYAAQRNIRLAVSGTGHDLLGRSDGYSSLELWMHHVRDGVDFQKTYTSANQCSKSGWTGSAIKVDGSYQWHDVYKVAEENNVIAVGGGALSVGVIGGWASGGGHGPATRNYGLGSDQILEAEVMLASGRVVIANHCENTDLFRAIRGGGPGYGITLSSTIKAHPNVDVVTAHQFAMAPLEETELNADLLDAVTVLLQSYADLNDAGFAGYAYWFRNFPTVFVGNATSGYTHGFWTIGKGREEAEKAWAPVRKALSDKFGDKLFMNDTWKTYNDYWTFYHAESGLNDPTGKTSMVTSRLIDRAAVEDYDKLRSTVDILSGSPEGVEPNVVLLVSGGQVFEDAKDTTSGLNPGWRKSHFVVVSGASMPPNPTNEQRQAVSDYITYEKGGATKKLAPSTGGYMNEGDRHDPDYKVSFYGDFYETHLKTKQKYDPSNVFYCPTCVGSDAFVERPDGPLCRA